MAANHLHSIVNTQEGEVVSVHLTGNAANVLLLDALNYANYEAGRAYQYFGGYYTRTPAVITPPHAGYWHVVVDLGGGAGRVGASVSVLPAD